MRPPRKECKLLVPSLLAVCAMLGCLSAEDPSDAVDVGDAEIASDAAARDVDATLDTQRPLDASAELDAQRARDAHTGSDASEGGPVDARACDPAPTTCAPPAEPSVRCGSEVCSGATPVCCKSSPLFSGPRCVGRAREDCVPADASAGTESLITRDYCDDTSDCAAGEHCRNSWSKGVSRRVGSACSAGCRHVENYYSFQLCARDCECDGMPCVDGCCGGCRWPQ